MISAHCKLSSPSTYLAFGVKAFPLVPHGISFISHWAKLITKLMCPKVGGDIDCDECLHKKNRLKYKMSRCCFNTLLPSLLSWSRSEQSIPPCHCGDRAAATRLLWHPSLLIAASSTLPSTTHSDLTVFSKPLSVPPLLLVCSVSNTVMHLLTVREDDSLMSFLYFPNLINSMGRFALQAAELVHIELPVIRCFSFLVFSTAQRWRFTY